MLAKAGKAGLDLDDPVGMPVDRPRSETCDVMNDFSSGGVLCEEVVEELIRVVMRRGRDDQLRHEQPE
jgi:hypothetical protein